MLALMEGVDCRTFRETNICWGALTLKVVLAAGVFVLGSDFDRGSASYRYIAKTAKNRTEKWLDGTELWKFFRRREGGFCCGGKAATQAESAASAFQG